MEKFKFLEESSAIKNYEIEDFHSSKSGRYFKIHITFIDHSSLSAREFSSEVERNYSFHWMDNKNNLIVRWDNAPYHQGISTYPHHKHKNNEIKESYEIILEEVVQYIETFLNR